MNILETVTARCPCCGEVIELTVDRSAGEEQYTEDCYVCCRPLQIRIINGYNGLFELDIRSEND